MENKEIKFNVTIKSIFKNSFVDKTTNETTFYYVAQLGNNLIIPITSNAVNSISNNDFNLCLINSFGKFKIDVYTDVIGLKGERIL